MNYCSAGAGIILLWSSGWQAMVLRLNRPRDGVPEGMETGQEEHLAGDNRIKICLTDVKCLVAKK